MRSIAVQTACAFGIAALGLALGGCVLGVKSAPSHERAKDPPRSADEPTAAELLGKGAPPGRPVAEPVGKPPTPDAVWISGYWHWSGVRYEWVVGHWVTKPGGWVEVSKLDGGH